MAGIKGVCMKPGEVYIDSQLDAQAAKIVRAFTEAPLRASQYCVASEPCLSIPNGVLNLQKPCHSRKINIIPFKYKF